MSKDKKKDRTKITPELEKRVAKLREKARNTIAKSEVLQFRLDEKTYQELFALAEIERKSVGTLVREWVTAIVKQKLIPPGQSSILPVDHGAGITVMEQQAHYTLETKIAAMQKQLNDLAKFTHQKLG